MKQIWDMSKYISFVFHQKSATVAVKEIKNEEEMEEDKENKKKYLSDDEDYCEDQDDDNGSNYSDE